MLYESIKKLVEYGIQAGLTPECERIYTTNLLLDLFQETQYEDVECSLASLELEDILSDLLAEAIQRGMIEDSPACSLVLLKYRKNFGNCIKQLPKLPLISIINSVKTVIIYAVIELKRMCIGQ